MENAKISVIQLFAIMFLFNLGTSLVVSYGREAKKDAWIAILLGWAAVWSYFSFPTFYFANIPIYHLPDMLENIG